VPADLRHDAAVVRRDLAPLQGDVERQKPDEQRRGGVVVLEDVFGGGTLEENESLQALQRIPMGQRRHCVVVLVGSAFATFNPMQAFQQGVHSVVNPSEVFLLIQLIQKAVADNDIFLHSFRQAQNRLC